MAYSLPTGKLHKKTEVKRLEEVPAGYESKFYRSLGDPFDKSFDTTFQRSIIKDVPSEDIKNFFQPVILANVSKTILTCMLLVTG